MVENPAQFRWSSYNAYVNKHNTNYGVIDRNEVLAMLSNDEKQAVKLFINYSNELENDNFIDIQDDARIEKKILNEAEARLFIAKFINRHVNLGGGNDLLFRVSLGNFRKAQRGIRNNAGTIPSFGSGPCVVEAAPAQGIPFKPYVNVPKDELDGEILAQMYESKIVGVSAAFVKDSQVVWANGYGWADLEKEKLVAPTTIFRIASVSKTITATALMQLWERGLFSLEDDISVYLGYLVRNPHHPNVRITFRMLLTHTSSILDSGGYEEALGLPRPPLLRDLLVPGGKAYSELTWGEFMPGTEFVYSNFGFGIIGALVEVISGERFDQYAVRHIFRPLGMDASYNVSDIVNFDEIAVLYKTSGDNEFYPAVDYFPTDERPLKKEYALPLGNYYIGPAGAVRSSVLDLAKFMIAHMNGGVYHGVRILQKHAADLMHQLQWYGYGMEGLFRYMGLGFHITDALADRRLIGHPGEAYGLLSDMYFNGDENAGVIFMTNGGYYKFLSSGFASIEVEVINTIFNKLVGKPLPIVRTITVIIGDNKVYTGTRMIFYPVLPDVKADDLYAPAITIADALETAIEFDDKSGALILSKGTVTIHAKTGNSYLEVNNDKVPTSSEIYLKSGFVMLPLITVAKLFGAFIDYNSIEKKFILSLPPA